MQAWIVKHKDRKLYARENEDFEVFRQAYPFNFQTQWDANRARNKMYNSGDWQVVEVEITEK